MEQIHEIAVSHHAGTALLDGLVHIGFDCLIMILHHHCLDHTGYIGAFAMNSNRGALGFQIILRFLDSKGGYFQLL